MRKNSIKNTRINMEVQRELSEIIRTQVKDPGLKGVMISVTDAEVTPDLKYCRAYISVLGSREGTEAAIGGLKRAVGFIRRELARRVNLRNTPEITFIPDHSIEYGVHMTKMIDDVTRDLHDREDEESAAGEMPDEAEAGRRAAQSAAGEIPDGAEAGQRAAQSAAGEVSDEADEGLSAWTE